MDQVASARRPFGSLLIEDGEIALDDGGRVDVRLRIPPDSRVAGGPIELRVVGPGVDFTGTVIDWLVTTNRGWAHFRGRGRTADTDGLEFRCDLRSARAAGESGPDLVSVRVYPAGADPVHDGPMVRLSGSLPAGTVRLGA
ncbi:MAG TPA: hypothetical protein VFX65_14725 [Candidatus Limnocylindrales bacterium]|nr:hypothetical protein [Candidatus Limnocylindrales bacterium]